MLKLTALVYYLPVAKVLQEAGFFASVVHAKLIHDFGNNTIRIGKTDKKDSIKIANYGLSYWMDLIPEKDDNYLRDALKKMNRQITIFTKLQTAQKNSLISLLDLTFPGINEMFSAPTKANGHDKWVDFLLKYRHSDCVSSLSFQAFSESYRKWGKKMGGHFSEEKAREIYDFAKKIVPVYPKDEHTKFMI